MLVVDDDEVSRFAASGLLEGLGFTVNVASDGREALEMTERWPYVAIFMDCEMPEVDGYTAARQLRARAGRNAATPVIAMTSKSRSVSLASGMDHHVSKPLETAVLEAGCRQLGLLRPEGIRPSSPDALVRVDAPLLDPTIFAAAPVADRSRQARAAASFVERTTACLPHIWRAINFGDAPALQTLARTLKDDAIAVGAERVAALCDSLCQAEASRATTLAADIEPQLQTVLVDTAAAIRAYTDGIPFTDGPAVQMSASSDSNLTPPQPREPLRVALADDDPLARMAISAMLEGPGWLELVGACASVEEIVALAADKRPDVVVLDWMMPGGGGRTAVRRILDRCPGTIIVALTSSNSQQASIEMTTAGASCSLVKGGPADQLTETIKRVASATAAAHAAAADTGSHRHGIDGAMTCADGPSDESPLDDQGIQRLQSEFASTGILADLVDLFVAQTPERLSELRRANQAGDAAALSAGAHQLKGRCLTLAAVHMAELCDKLETTVRAGSLAHAATLIDQIQHDFEKAQAALTAISSRTNP